MSDRYRCILLFGPPGVGKGTQGKRLGQRAEFVHLATGDVFRSLDRTSAMGKKFVEYSSRGELVPDDLTIEVWKAHVRGLIDKCAYDPGTQLLILDGMPRSVRQAEMLDRVIDPLGIVFLTAPDLSEMVRRMQLRAETEGRHDDTDEQVIRRRFEVYDQETAPVLRHYPTELISKVDAIGSIEEVSRRIDDAMSRILPARC